MATLGARNQPPLGVQASTNAQAQALLTALVAFIQPLANAIASNSNNFSGARLEDRVEGKVLVKALEDFVSATLVRAQAPTQPQIARNEYAPPSVNEPPTMSRVLAMPEEIIMTKIREVLRLHVNNKMPIRMLAFDPKGGNIRLVTREEAISLLIRTTFAAAAQANFQDEWEAWEDNPDLRAGWKGQEDLVKNLVNHHARYAILSHKWLQGTPGEVVYQTWEKRKSNPRGYSKVTKFCEIAAQEYGVCFGWMDTACIDKGSSTELDESIRSMYKWYREAHVCITYMADTRKLQDMHEDSWFSRGWTLQELLAPRNIQFYNKAWVGFMPTKLGSAERLPLFPIDSDIQVSIIEEITEGSTITQNELALCQRGQVDLVSISRKFELAATREVTRQEDQVYSLMGLLGVDISVAYGEGSQRALYRLLKELLDTKKKVLDIFNCSYGEYDNEPLTVSSSEIRALPSSIKQYIGRSADFDPSDSVKNLASMLDRWPPVQALTSTHLGVHVPLILVPALLDQPGEAYIPKKGFRGVCELGGPAGHLDYNLLDYKLYEDTYVTDAHLTDGQPSIVIFGVLNFTKENGYVGLPTRCLGIPLDCGDMKPVNLRHSKQVKIVQTTRPPVFEMESDTKKLVVREKDLNDHGMQFVTLYV